MGFSCFIASEPGGAPRDRRILADLGLFVCFTAPDPSQQSALGDDGKPRDDAPAVRFASAVEEFSPTAKPAKPLAEYDDSFNEVSADQLKAFTKSLHGRPLQERRMTTYQFEAFSLPPSRVRPSHCSRSPSNGFVC